MHSTDKVITVTKNQHTYKGIGTITFIYKNEVDPQDIAKAIILENIDNKKAI